MNTHYLNLEEDEKLLIPDHWKIVKKNVNMATVTDGKREGRTPIKNHGDSFHCPQCDNFGPWNGVVCLSCGFVSDE